MGYFAEELRAGINEAALKMAEARQAGDDHAAEAYRERLGFLRRVANRHGLGPWPEPAVGPAGARDQDAATPVQGGGLAPGAVT